MNNGVRQGIYHLKPGDKLVMLDICEAQDFQPARTLDDVALTDHDQRLAALELKCVDMQRQLLDMAKMVRALGDVLALKEPSLASGLRLEE